MGVSCGQEEPRLCPIVVHNRTENSAGAVNQGNIFPQHELPKEALGKGLVMNDDKVKGGFQLAAELKKQPVP